MGCPWQRMTVYVFVCLLIGIPTAYVRAQASDQSKEQLQQQIDDTNAKIQQLQKEISQLQTQLSKTTTQKKTLTNAIVALNINIQKLQKNIALYTAQIAQKDKQITQLSTTIATTTNEIQTSQNEAAEALRALNKLDHDSYFVTMLAGGTLSSFFDRAVSLSTVRDSLESKILLLSSLKDKLQETKTTEQRRRQELASLQAGLSQQKKGLAITLDSQAQLLNQTKNKESEYQAMIAKKKAQQAQFEQDLLDFESKLNLIVDVGTLPAVGSQPLGWPLDTIRITQYFGNTAFATAHSVLYNGHGHSGIDFAASPGTPIKAARGGVVLGTGNTDITCPGASYGKWVFIKHDDGLNTLYAHLSSISTSKGETVSRGDVIGYSGSTGYATGPHLHFGVYASDGSEIASFASKSCAGRTYTMPVGTLSAYLNPLSYLPPEP